MLTALLFDLDGTLLDSNMDIFMPPYFRALAAKLSAVVPPDHLNRALLASTQAMFANDGKQTNEQAFWADFLPRLRCSIQDLLPLLHDFYANDFPRLRSYTAPKPEARPLLLSAFAAGFDVAIATQPVFPLVAVRHRMDWAGINDLPFKLVTCFENMHTTKPNPAFYLEVCRTIGHPPETCMMIGNEPQADIVPAAAAGLKTFWLNEAPLPAAVSAPPGPAGTLSDLRRLIESGAIHRLA